MTGDDIFRYLFIFVTVCIGLSVLAVAAMWVVYLIGGARG